MAQRKPSLKVAFDVPGERSGSLMVSIYGPAAAGDVGCHLCFALPWLVSVNLREGIEVRGMLPGN